MKKNDQVVEILLNETEIADICRSLGKQISTDYANKPLILVGLLKGCIPFMSDLMRHINLPLEVYYMVVSSYHGGIRSSGDLTIKYDLERSVKDQNILLIEDVVDTGLTITAVIEMFKYRGATSVEVVTLLDKPGGRLVEYTPRYIGKKIPKKFVIGYGLDYQEKYRNLPYVGVLDPKVYEKE